MRIRNERSPQYATVLIVGRTVHEDAHPASTSTVFPYAEDHRHHVAWLASLCSPASLASEITYAWVREMTRLQLSSRADNGRETRVVVDLT